MQRAFIIAFAATLVGSQIAWAQSGGWLVSVSGEPVMRMECLQGSPLPDALRGMGYSVESTGESRERLIPSAITEKLVRTLSGAFGFATEGSTAKVALRITHPGFVTVEEFVLSVDGLQVAFSANQT